MSQYAVPENPHELILAEDLVAEVKRRLGRHHPIYKYLEVALDFQKDDIPQDVLSNLSGETQERISDKWMSTITFPYYILSRLANAGDLKPVCWIRREYLDSIKIATSSMYGWPSAALDAEIAEITKSWLRVYPRLAAKEKATLTHPSELGEDWMGLLEWRLPKGKEVRLYGSDPQPDFSWQPFYRMGDIGNAINILRKDVTNAVVFFDIPVRHIVKHVSSLRKQYNTADLPRPYIQPHKSITKPPSLQKIRMDTRRHIIKCLKDHELDLRQVKEKFSQWQNLASKIAKKLEDYKEAGLAAEEHNKNLAKNLKVDLAIVEIVRDLLATYKKSSKKSPQDEVDQLFQCTRKTIERDWRYLDL